MSIDELIDAVKAALAADGGYGCLHQDQHEYAVRFDSRTLQPGDTLDASRHNIDRDDERDFPAYDDPEYTELPMLNGTSAYTLTDLPRHLIDAVEQEGVKLYLISGNVLPGGVVVEHDVAPFVTIEHQDTLDVSEIVVEDAEVVARLA